MDVRTCSCALVAACLLAACGGVEESPRAEAPAAIEPAAASPAATPQPQQAASQARPAMPAVEALTDTAITGRIESALRSDPQMSGADVSINTDKGVVILSGTVKSHEQTGIASAHAQQQDGVMRVDNHLRPEFS